MICMSKCGNLLTAVKSMILECRSTIIRKSGYRNYYLLDLQWIRIAILAAVWHKNTARQTTRYFPIIFNGFCNERNHSNGSSPRYCIYQTQQSHAQIYACSSCAWYPEFWSQYRSVHQVSAVSGVQHNIYGVQVLNLFLKRGTVHDFRTGWYF